MGGRWPEAGQGLHGTPATRFSRTASALEYTIGEMLPIVGGVYTRRAPKKLCATDKRIRCT